MKCKCKLEIVVIDQAPDCPVHPDPITDTENDARQEERENILAALGEHPDSPVDIPERVAAIRDEGRAHFHNLTRLQETVDRVLKLLSPTDKDLEHAVRNKLQVIMTLQGNAEDDEKQIAKFKEEYVHQDLLFDCQDKLRRAEEQLKLRGPRLAEVTTKESCPSGYR